MLKINSDGAYNDNSGDGGWGFVIRDSNGEVIQAGAGRAPHLLDAIQAEVLACLAGIRMARGMMRVVTETDSLMLKMAIEGGAFSSAPTGGLIHKIKLLASSSFIKFSV
ncbi:hypothetical protein BAE44_0003224 [Dichanthelium oligosanthes]|uniref:RNase H type-1 domain-containing protein n=1 Tax=Dichanthelium oligosanthes TaxID=888268 RepID=A0A1E5WEF5_9POAL|nr:hypothetical protein BAE44_0003224 [Dichanthelium oligosanthes]